MNPQLSLEARKQTLLVVEDNVALRYTLAEWLRMQDYVVVEAATADEAMDVLRSPLAVDLIVTDVHMPGAMNGLDLVREVKGSFPAIPLIVVSGEAERLEIATPTAFFRKPYDLKQLSECVKKMLAGIERNGL